MVKYTVIFLNLLEQPTSSSASDAERDKEQDRESGELSERQLQKPATPARSSPPKKEKVSHPLHFITYVTL